MYTWRSVAGVQWFGKDSNRKEQAKGLQVANRIRATRSDAPTNCTLLSA